jgi:integrase
MTTKLTQASVNRARDDHPAGTQLHDEQVSGLRLVVGKTSTSYKLVGRINDGSKRYVSLVLGRTDELSLKSARDEATRLRLELRQGVDPRTPKTTVPTVEEALERYLESRPHLSPRTVSWYRSLLAGPLSSLRKLPADKLERDRVRALHERLSRDIPGAANGAMRTLKAILNDVARTHDLPMNVVTRAVRMNKERPRQWAVAARDMPDLWEGLDRMEDRVRRGSWVTMLLTGLRSHDARTMRWDHIDEDGVLTVPSPKGGEDKAFRLPLSRHLRKELEALRAYTAPLESPFVFPSPASKRGHLAELRRTDAFDHAPHAMRHTYRTMCMEAGVDLGMTQVLLNHRPAGVTWNYVTRANLLGPMREASERVADLIVRFRSA